jgi:hypothetical protein
MSDFLPQLLFLAVGGFGAFFLVRGLSGPRGF